VYDIGGCGLVDKTKNKDHGDSVTDVAVNPRFYEWTTASIDGYVRTFRYPATKIGNKVRRGNPGGGLDDKVNTIIKEPAMGQHLQVAPQA